MYRARLEKLRKSMSERNIDALLVTNLSNIFYLSGFTGSTAVLVVTGDASYILVDFRYTLQATTECVGTKVIEYSGKPAFAALGNLINEIKPKSLGFESDVVTVASHRKLRNAIDASVKLRSTVGLVAKLRSVKDEHEISLIRKAAEIADAVYAYVITAIKPGMTEKDAALLIDSSIRRLGGDKEGFDTIAAYGPNAASPHASPTDAVLQTGQLFKMDYGVRYKNYNSDITRTVCLGNATAKQKEIYKIVLDAQLKAIEAIKPNRTGKEIDAVARDYIASMGYGDNFGHGLGHGIGIEVHDGPAFSVLSDIILEPGMVATVEPGIYIEGWGGIRIEDDVLVTDTGVEIITKAPKEFTCI